MRDKSVDRYKTYSEPGHMGICICFKREFSPTFSKACFSNHLSVYLVLLL